MNYRIPGLMSIVLLLAAVGIADYQLCSISFGLGIAFVIGLLLAFTYTLYSYCRKCPHATSQTCRHVVLGWIVNKLFKPLAPSPYTGREIMQAALPAAVIIILAQYWLVQNIERFITFWTLLLITGVIIRTSVCRECQNLNCKMCPNGRACNKSI